MSALASGLPALDDDALGRHAYLPRKGQRAESNGSRSLAEEKFRGFLMSRRCWLTARRLPTTNSSMPGFKCLAASVDVSYAITACELLGLT